MKKRKGIHCYVVIIGGILMVLLSSFVGPNIYSKVMKAIKQEDMEGEQKLSLGDYTYLWYPDGYGKNKSLQYIKTGNYGLAWSADTSSITKLGVLQNNVDSIEAAKQDDTVMEALTETQTVIQIGEEIVKRGKSAGIITSGTYMQITKRNIYTKSYEGTMSISALPDYFIINLAAKSVTKKESVECQISFHQSFNENYNKITFNDDKSIVTCSDEDGEGITFITYNGKLDIHDNNVVLHDQISFTNQEETEIMTLVVIPSKHASLSDGKRYREIQNTISLEYTSLRQDGQEKNEAKIAQYDEQRGVFSVKIDAMDNSLSDESRHMDVNRIAFTVNNPLREETKLYLSFDGGGQSATYIPGGAPMLRDIEGKPIGIPVQISKNWHEGGGKEWYNLYTIITVPAKTSITYEFTMAATKWGETYAVSHAQLALLGYVDLTNSGLWEESALANFGESVTYDPNVVLGRSMVDDVRPFLVKESGKWIWTGNVGGADFLKYEGQQIGNAALKSVKVNHIYNGPNLTKVQYSGVSNDEKIHADILVQLGRTDDVNRNYYTLKYTFNEQVTSNRLCFFQMAADGYQDNSFNQIEYGIGNTILGNENQSGKIITGSEDGDLWGYLFDSSRKEDKTDRENGNILMVVRSYRFTDGNTGEVISIPVMRLSGTQAAFELIAPSYLKNKIPKGSYLEAEIEYVVTPAVKEHYYGESEYLLAMTSEQMNSSYMAKKQVVDGKIHVEPIIGKVLKTSPIEIEANLEQQIVAQFMVQGGLGYVPLTIQGLPSYHNWELQGSLDGKQWNKIDQSSKKTDPDNENYKNNETDFWQCNYNPVSNSYEITYNVKNNQDLYYRLVRINTN